MEIGLSLGGFVDVLLLPEQSEDWPAERIVGEFEIWWTDSRQRIRLKPSESLSA
ncbi:hypothetical protein OHU11_01505 [Streptomyces sp. NBC_00257]|uniref:hypothetical protein n=1 Tax=unclassified Streptomyces TaxID=2593676 RepID=UPI0022592B9D|nr:MULTISPECIES: hypothetical protein [unclassified Streptomyces]MCX5426423.1 hypothetical protein [Streptomyces sp. NBC_00062]